MNLNLYILNIPIEDKYGINHKDLKIQKKNSIMMVNLSILNQLRKKLKDLLLRKNLKKQNNRK